MPDATATSAAHRVEVAVRAKGKSLAFAETVATGSVYAVSVRGGSATCGQTAVLRLVARGAVVASCALVCGEGTLSLMTSEMREACRRLPLGAHVPVAAVLRCLDEGAERNVAIGVADVVHAGDEWYDEATTYGMWTRMGYGALRILHCDADDSWHLVRVKTNALGQFVLSVDQEPVSFSSSTETVVYRVGDQAVEGVKSFASSPLVPTAAASDSSAKAASTEFVRGAVDAALSALDAGWGARFRAALLAAANRWTGRQEFAAVPSVGTAADDSDGAEAASTGWVAAWWRRAKSALLSAANTWGGRQSFSQPPSVPTVEDAADSGPSAASTEFVQRAVAAAVAAAGAGAPSVPARYAMAEKRLVDGACALDDRAVNTLSMGTATLATLTVPEAHGDGTARDFWLVVTVPGTADVAVALEGASFHGETADTFALEVGSVPNVLVFTEIAPGYFAVSRRTHSTESSTLAT